MKIITVTAMHGRQKTVEKFAQNTFTEVACAVTTNQDYKFAMDKGWHVVRAVNKPLWRKWDAALQLAKSLDPDAILAMGSDDVMSEKTFTQIENDIEDYPFLAFEDIYIYDLYRDKMYYWPGYHAFVKFQHRRGEPAGAGRVFRRDLLDECNWGIWRGAVDRGLDGDSWKVAKKYPRKLYNCERDGFFLADIKDGQGVTNISWFLNHPKPKIKIQDFVKW